MIKKIDHIAIAVNSLDDALKQFCDVLGFKAEDVKIETLEEKKFRTVKIPVGETMLQLVEPTSPETGFLVYPVSWMVPD